MDDLAALRPTAVLDVGCGTGKAAAALTERGLRVQGIEPDERMAEVARAHGVDVEVAALEDWDDAGRTFDLITCAQAWHWIDPDLGVATVAKVLRPGGTIARFWNFQVLDEPLLSAVDAVYRELAPDADGHGRDPGHDSDDDPFADNAAFFAVQRRTYPWVRSFTTEEWVGFVATTSDHQRLGAERLTALTEALHTTLERFGGVVSSQCGTYAEFARRTRAVR